MFNGKDLTGWEGETQKTWRVEDGPIVGGSLDAAVPCNEFLCTTKSFGDFELKLKFKSLGDRKQANAGVQFRTQRIPNERSEAVDPVFRVRKPVAIPVRCDLGKGRAIPLPSLSNGYPAL